jgi:integrase
VATDAQHDTGSLRRDIPSAATSLSACRCVDQLHFHCLRHHLASLLIDSGCDVKTVQARMRHSSAKTTLDVYGHMWPERDETTRTAIGGVIAARLPASSEDSAGALRAKRP